MAIHEDNLTEASIIHHYVLKGKDPKELVEIVKHDIGSSMSAAAIRSMIKTCSKDPEAFHEEVQKLDEAASKKKPQSFTLDQLPAALPSAIPKILKTSLAKKGVVSRVALETRLNFLSWLDIVIVGSNDKGRELETKVQPDSSLWSDFFDTESVPEISCYKPLPEPKLTALGEKLKLDETLMDWREPSSLPRLILSYEALINIHSIFREFGGKLSLVDQPDVVFQTNDAETRDYISIGKRIDKLLKELNTKARQAIADFFYSEQGSRDRIVKAQFGKDPRAKGLAKPSKGPLSDRPSPSMLKKQQTKIIAGLQAEPRPTAPPAWAKLEEKAKKAEKNYLKGSSGHRWQEEREQQLGKAWGFYSISEHGPGKTIATEERQQIEQKAEAAAQKAAMGELLAPHLDLDIVAELSLDFQVILGLSWIYGSHPFADRILAIYQAGHWPAGYHGREPAEANLVAFPIPQDQT